jgi:hypothetical protein
MFFHVSSYFPLRRTKMCSLYGMFHEDNIFFSYFVKQNSMLSQLYMNFAFAVKLISDYLQASNKFENDI